MDRMAEMEHQQHSLNKQVHSHLQSPSQVFKEVVVVLVGHMFLSVAQRAV
jgi:hypothetical protein